MKFLMVLFGIIDKEDWYNTQVPGKEVPWLQVLWLRVSGKCKRGQVYNIKPWW